MKGLDYVAEVSGVTMVAATYITVTTKWGEYIAEPANQVSLVVAIATVVFIVIRSMNEWYRLKGRKTSKADGVD